MDIENILDNLNLPQALCLIFVTFCLLALVAVSLYFLGDYVYLRFLRKKSDVDIYRYKLRSMFFSDFMKEIFRD